MLCVEESGALFSHCNLKKTEALINSLTVWSEDESTYKFECDVKMNIKALIV